MGRDASKRRSLPTYVKMLAPATETLGSIPPLFLTLNTLQAGDGVLTVSYVKRSTTIPQPTTSVVARLAVNSLSRRSPSTLGCVKPMMFQLPLLNEYPESVSLKCTGCKGVHEHTVQKVVPVADEEMDPLALLKLSKRITCCSNCGLLKLIN